jgi:hypothetical protein
MSDMKTKKLFATLLMITGLFCAKDIAAAVPVNPQPLTEHIRAEKLISRLNEIQSMDMNKLNRAEKKKLRKEVRSIEQQLQAVGGGVYISGAALLIIIILLIILL